VDVIVPNVTRFGEKNKGNACVPRNTSEVFAAMHSAPPPCPNYGGYLNRQQRTEFD
jgi:hypothetical protein